MHLKVKVINNDSFGVVVCEMFLESWAGCLLSRFGRRTVVKSGKSFWPSGCTRCPFRLLQEEPTLPHSEGRILLTVHVGLSLDCVTDDSRAKRLGLI